MGSKKCLPLILACILSVALHALLITGFPVKMPERDERLVPHTLEARLVPMKPSAPIKAPPKIAKAKPKQQENREQPPEIENKEAPPESTEETPIAEESSSETQSTPQQSGAEMLPIPEDAQNKSLAADVDTPAQETIDAAAPKKATLPNRLVIRFSVIWDGLTAGKAEYRWVQAGNRYDLQLFTQTTGIIGFFKTMWIEQTSAGEITENGLRPESFVNQRSNKPAERAVFDWAGQSLRLMNGDESKTVPLLAHAQDLVSILFQFAFVPPNVDKMQLAVVTGRKLDMYQFLIVGEETLRLPIGEIRTLHVRRNKTESDDGLDAWLAMERHYLPVKIVRSDRKDDRPVELIATEVLAGAGEE